MGVIYVSEKERDQKTACAKALRWEQTWCIQGSIERRKGEKEKWEHGKSRALGMDRSRRGKWATIIPLAFALRRAATKGLNSGVIETAYT